MWAARLAGFSGGLGSGSAPGRALPQTTCGGLATRTQQSLFLCCKRTTSRTCLTQTNAKQAHSAKKFLRGHAHAPIPFQARIAPELTRAARQTLVQRGRQIGGRFVPFPIFGQGERISDIATDPAQPQLLTRCLTRSPAHEITRAPAHSLSQITRPLLLHKTRDDRLADFADSPPSLLTSSTTYLPRCRLTLSPTRLLACLHA